MGRIPQHFIDEVLARTDIVEVIEPRVTLKKKGSEYSACCPFHNEKTPSFTVSQTKQFYHCFGCGAHGTAIGFLMEHDHLSFVEAIETLAEINNMEAPREDNPQRDKQQSELKPLYAALTAADELFRQQLKDSDKAKQYLQQRGFTGETAKNYAVGYALDSWNELLNTLKKDHSEKTLHGAGLLSKNDKGRVYDKFRDRIMFPIRDRRGRCIAFGGRVIDQGEPKYLNSPETKVFHKGNTLYGLFEARRDSKKLTRIMVVDGYMDCVALAQYGISNVVATLGTAVTRDHLQQLMRVVKHIVICFDGDRAGRKAARRALDQSMHVLKDGMRVDFMFLPDGEDPDSLVQKIGTEAFLEKVDQAQPLSAYLLDVLKEGNPGSSAESRTGMAIQARDILKPLGSGLLKQQLLNEVSDLTQTSMSELSSNEPAKTTPRRSRVRTSNRQRQLEMTAMRQAIAVILQQPSSAGMFSDELLSKLHNLPGGDLLGELVDLCRDQPDITNAIILENYRETSHFNALQQLSAWAPPNDPQSTPENVLNALLSDAINQLQRQYSSERIDDLVVKEGAEGLTDEEKAEFRQLLRLRS